MTRSNVVKLTSYDADSNARKRAGRAPAVIGLMILAWVAASPALLAGAWVAKLMLGF